jgi:hypothetical protein
MAREPAWVRKSIEVQEKRAREPKPQGYLYIMSRGDGWHKIGVTDDVDSYRHYGVSRFVPKHLRPVKNVTRRPVYGPLYLAEKLAHDELVRLGYERGNGNGQTEWFAVSESVARRVVRMAAATVRDSEKVGKIRIGRLREQWRRASAKQRSARSWPAGKI